MSLKVRKNGQWVTIGIGEKGLKGDKGVKGDKGFKGFKGDPSDVKGEKGEKGFKGEFVKGQKGQQGDQGNDGDSVKGEKGFKGEKGDKGQKGEGEKGIKGEEGDKGSKGDKGIGIKGEGIKGDKGDKSDVKGDKGEKGEGAKGESVKGDKGFKGDKGEGVKGEGIKGDEGEKGVKGDKGEFKGEKGSKGESAKGDKGDAKGEKGAPGGNPVGNNNTVQYNLNGNFAGASKALYSESDPEPDPITGSNVPTLRLEGFGTKLNIGQFAQNFDGSGTGNAAKRLELSTDSIRGTIRTFYPTSQGSESGALDIIAAGGVFIKQGSSEPYFIGRAVGGSEVYHDGTKAFQTFRQTNAPTHGLQIPSTMGIGFSGSTTANHNIYFKAPAALDSSYPVGAAITFTLPTNTGTLDQSLVTDGNGILSFKTISGGGGGTPAGSDKQLQFNDNGVFGGTSNIEYIKSTGNLEATGSHIRVQKDSTADNSATISADGGLELIRKDYSQTTGGPYIDFTYNAADMDARIQMDPGATGTGPGDTNAVEFSSLIFKTGGGDESNYFGSLNPNVAERLRIGKSGEIGIGFRTDLRDTGTAGVEQIYGKSGQVLTSAGIGQSVFWSDKTNAITSTNKIEQGNTKAEVNDTGTNGHFLVETEGVERLRINETGISTFTGSLTVKALNIDTTGAGDGDLLSSGGSDGIFGIFNTTNSGQILFTAKDSGGTYNEKFRFGSAGQLGIAGANYGTSGQVLTSGGPSAAPSWEDAGGTAKGILGEIVAWGGAYNTDADIPDGYILCDGRGLDTETYAELFAVLGYTHGGSGSTFNIPNLRNKFVVGAGGSYNVADQGGTNSNTLTTSNIPQHFHYTLAAQYVGMSRGASNVNANQFVSFGTRTGGGWEAYNMRASSVTANVGKSSNAGGTGGTVSAIENRPPYYALCYIINATGVSGSGGSGSGSSFELLSEKSATGTEVEFTGIPADAMEITLMFKGVSLNATNDMLVQLGTSSGYITSGYVSNSENTQGTTAVSSSNGFVIYNNTIGDDFHGSMDINKASSTSYTAFGGFRRSNSGGAIVRGSLSSASGTIERLKVTIKNQNNADAFDAGTMSLSYKTSGSGGSGGSGGTTGTTKVAILKDQKNANVGSGAGANNTWIDRDITVKTDPHSFVTLNARVDGQTTESTATRRSAANGISYFALPAGTYKIKFRATGYFISQHQAAMVYSSTENTINKVYATTDNVTKIYGTSETSTNNTTTSDSTGTEIVTIDQTTYFKVIHYTVSTFGTSDFGQTSSPDKNVYLEIEVEDLKTAVKEVGTSRVAVLQDVRTQGTNGGQASTNSWHQRILNSKIDSTNFVTILNGTTGRDGTGNTFSLGAGTYLLQWRAPGFDSGDQRAKIAYTTSENYDTLFSSQSSSGVSYLSGESAQSQTNYESNIFASGSATVTISQTTYFRLQHYVTSNDASSTKALGEAGDINGEDEIYSQVIIEDLTTAIKNTGDDYVAGTTKVAVVKDQKNHNVDGGTFSSGAWRDRDLTVKDDPFNFVTLYPTTNGQTSESPGNDPGYFSLLPGKYKIRFSAPAFKVDRHMAAMVWSSTESYINKTYSTSDPRDGESHGSSEISQDDNGRVSNHSKGTFVVEITQTSYFKVIHYAQTGQGSNGFGESANIGSVDPETYTIVEIEDLATAVKGVGTSKVAVLQDVRSESVNGGANETITAGAWHQRKLNSKYDTQDFVTFENGTTGKDGTNNIFSLPAGTYLLQWKAPGYNTGKMFARIAYTTSTNYVNLFSNNDSSLNHLDGETSEEHADNTGITNYATGSATITTTQTTYFALQHYISSVASFAPQTLGRNNDITGVNEIYSQVIIEDLETAVLADKIQEGNTSVETVDTGSNGHVKVTTEGTEQLRIYNNGIINMGRALTDDPVLASGNVNAGLKLLGATSSSTPGDGYGLVVNAKSIVGIFNRTHTTGRIVEFKNDASVVGAIESDANNILEILGENATKFKVGGEEKLRITSDGDAIIGQTVSSSSVLGGGIYTRTIDMTASGTPVNNQTYTVTKDFFTFDNPHGAIAGTVFGAVNGNYLSSSFIYHFAACAGNGNVSMTNSGYKSIDTNTFNMSLSISQSDAPGYNKHTLTVSATYKHNGNSTDPTTGGPKNPNVTLTVVLGAANKEITVTRPTTGTG